MNTTRRLVIFIVIAVASTFMGIHAQNLYTFDADIKPILDSNCSSCHSWMSSHESVLAKKSDASPATMALSIVYPGKPDSSVIVWRIEGALPGGGFISRMPQGEDKLADQTIQMVKDWIHQGALNELPVSAPPASWVPGWGEVKRQFK